MNSEDLYKHLYEAVQEDRNDANDRLCEYVVFDLKSKLGHFYWDFIDYVVVNQLKEIIESLEEDTDKYETPDNKAFDLSSVYRTLKYYLTDKDYKAWVEKRRVVNETS